MCVCGGGIRERWVEGRSVGWRGDKREVGRRKECGERRDKREVSRRKEWGWRGDKGGHC